MKIILTLLCIFYLGVINSQTFNKRLIYTDEVVAMDFSKLLLKNDTLMCIGRGAVYQNGYPTRLMIVKTDLEGELLDIDFFAHDTLHSYAVYYGVGVDEKDGEILLAGRATVGNNYPHAGAIMKLKENGDEKWFKEHSSSEISLTYYYVYGRMLDDGQSILLANKQTTGSLNDYSVSTVIVGVNGEGEVEWEQEFESSSAIFKVGCLYEDSDSTLLVGMEVRENVSDPDLRTHRSTIYRINHEGEVLAEWQNDNDKSYAPRNIERTPDGGFVFVGRHGGGVGESSGLLVYQGYICKLDSDLEKEWELPIGRFTVNATFYSVAPTSAGDFVATGVTIDTLADGSWMQQGWLLKFNELGDILWERKILSGSDRASQITDIVELPDGGLVACGLSQSETEDYPHRGWLLRMDEYGCFDGEPCDSIVSTADFTIIPQPLVEVYPNPAADYFRVQTSDHQNIECITVFSALGQQVWSADNLHQTAINVTCSNWGRGTYFVRVNDAWSGRVVVY